MFHFKYQFQENKDWNQVVTVNDSKYSPDFKYQFQENKDWNYDILVK